MSDHEERASEHGYDAIMPELDDHRRQAASVYRQDRPRRGTFDSLYGPRGEQTTHTGHYAASSSRGHDLEQAIDDEDAMDSSPAAHRSRRPTVESIADHRSISPPNSVKAFAEARRREREMSFSEPADRHHDAHELQRAVSVASRRSHRSRPHTVADDAASLSTNKSAEEDVCYPLQDEQRRKDGLYIDFDYLENFIQSNEAEVRAGGRHEPQDFLGEPVEGAKVFDELRPTQSASGAMPTYLATSDGDIMQMPSDDSTREEKRAHTSDGNAPPAVTYDPNKFSFFSSAWESTIHSATLGDLVLPGEDIRGLFTFPPQDTDGVWWLNVNDPTPEEVRALCRAFGAHPLTIEDITTQESREKIELFPSYYFACFRSFGIKPGDKDAPEKDREDEEPVYVPFNLYVIVFREGTLSFSFAKNSHAAQVRKRIAMLKDYVALSSDWICYAIIDDIVDSFAPVITQIERESDQIEDDVFVARKDDMNKFLKKIGTVRKNVMSLLRLLGGKADVLRGFTKRCNENYKVTPRMDIGLYLGDIQDHVITMTTNLGHVEKILSRSHSNYLAQLSIDSITQGTSTNRGLSKITLLASIIVPLNVVTGLFGMNVTVPWMASGSLIPFYGIIGSLGFLVVIMIAMARYLRYV